MNLSSIVSNINLSVCFNNYRLLEAMKGEVITCFVYWEVQHVFFKSWQGAVQHSSNEAHGLWKSQSSVRELKSYHSLGKNLSRGFSMTEHVESELLLLLLPGRQRNEPNGNQRKRKREKEYIHRKIQFQRENCKRQSSFVLKNQNLLSLKTSLGSLANMLYYQSHAELETVFL